MHDGRIHPTRIEEIVEKVKTDIEKLMIEEAEKVIFEVGLSDFHPELVKVLGRLKVPNQLWTEQSVPCSCKPLTLRDHGVGIETGRQARRSGRPAARHRQSGQSRGRRAACHAGCGDREKIRRTCQGRERDRGAPRAGGTDLPETVLVAAAEALSAARPVLVVRP